MSDALKKLYEERLGRYQSAIALEKTDRVPITTGSNYFSEVYSGYTNQEIVYDSEKWLLAEKTFIRDFPETDALRNNRIWGPIFDAVGSKTYKLPGRDLPKTVQFQFVEEEYMKKDEYRYLVDDPAAFMLERILPRIFGELNERGSNRSYMAFLKGGMAQMMWSQIQKNRSLRLQEDCGMPQPMTGAFLAPFDLLADVLRGLNGILLDIYRRPDNVLEACDVLVDVMVNFALANADPLKRYPIFVPTHKACFLSPDQFAKFYWPSFKKTMQKLIDAGYSIRAYLEGDWGHHWSAMLEMPKGKVLCDIDTPGDIFKAKKEIGHHQCLAGGVPDSLFILGTPQEMRERVKLLCDTVGENGGFIINGGCNIPYHTKPENYRAMIDATLDFGVYDKAYRAPVQTAPTVAPGFTRKKIMMTPWAQKLDELGSVKGEEDLIREPWESLESMAYNWLWQWIM